MELRSERWRALCASLAAVAVGAGCAPSQSQRHAALERDWVASAPVRSSAREAPLFTGATLERAALVRQVLARNPSLRAARHAWRAALARHPQAVSLDDPMLGAGLAPRSLGSDTVDTAAMFDLTQKLPFPGRLRLRGEAALAEAAAAAHDFAAVRLRLAAMASLLFDDYVLAARSLSINSEHMELLAELQSIATARYEAGEASQHAPIQAEVELTHAIHREVVLATTLQVTREQINALLHRSPSAPLPPPPADFAVPEVGFEHADDEAADRALAARPELAAADARVAGGEAQVDLARLAFYPDVTLVGRYNGVHQESDLQPFVGVQLELPLRRARRRAALDEAQARLEQVRAEREALADTLRLEASTAAARLGEAQHVARLFRDRLLPAARDQVDAARTSFETGRGSFLALIDAERNLRNVQLGHAETLADVGRRRAQLDRARGQIAGVAW